MAKYLRHKIGDKAFRIKKAGLEPDIARDEDEKEKTKAVYLLPEKELKRYVKDAIVSSENPAGYLLRKLETRLDNIVFRLGFAPDRLIARELILSGHVFINGGKMDDAGFHVGPRDIIEFKKNDLHKRLLKGRRIPLPGWLISKNNTARMRHTPSYNELKRKDIDMKKVIEYYLFS